MTVILMVAAAAFLVFAIANIHTAFELGQRAAGGGR
jgi:hypothetical protein